MRTQPMPIAQIPGSLCNSLSHVFLDLDDTVTQDGYLPASSYSALWDLSRAGLSPVPVTGRPAGWCDLIARLWPVAGVIGENGAFYFRYDRNVRHMLRVWLVSEEERMRGQVVLNRVRDHVMHDVPGVKVSADQAFRSSDLAVDYREDTGPTGKDTVDHICRIVRHHGANCKVSSIHVNCWYGDHDKLSCLKLFLSDTTGVPFDRMQNRILYIGDSPNDAPMFRTLAHTVGVANIQRFLADIDHPPRYVTNGESAAGFCELVSLILAKRR